MRSIEAILYADPPLQMCKHGAQYAIIMSPANPKPESSCYSSTLHHCPDMNIINQLTILMHIDDLVQPL